MYRKLFAVLLIGAIAAAQDPGPARSEDKAAKVRDQVRVIWRNAAQLPVEVQLDSGERMRGWIQETTDTGFSLKPAQKGLQELQTYRFEDLKSVRSVDSPKPFSKRWILLGVVVFLGLVLGIGLATNTQS